jgi:hypothetical protein
MYDLNVAEGVKWSRNMLPEQLFGNWEKRIYLFWPSISLTGFHKIENEN